MDKTNFSDLKACDPEGVMSRTGCRFDKTRRQYHVTIWGQPYCVDLKNDEIRPHGEKGRPYHDYLHLFIVFFLMKSSALEPSGEWVSEKDIPGGAAFFRGPHTIPADLITKRFKENITLFKNACETLEGVPLDMADAAFLFHITPTIPVAVLYWIGDEEFPSEAKLLFDRTIAQHLPLDIIYALSVGICHALGGTGE